MLILYHAWPSSASRRVRFCLAEKGLDYEGREVDLFSFRQHQPEYRRLNPLGVVPTLIHDGHVLYESTVINEYLDEVFPEPPLKPADALGRARMRVWTKYIDDVCLPAILVVNWNHVMHPIASKWSDEEMERRIAAVPTPERKEAWRRMAREPSTDAEVAAALGRLRESLDRMERDLADGPWLAGDTLSLADLNQAPYVRRMEELEPAQIAPERRPRVADWWRRITARPAYAKAGFGAFAAAATRD